MSRRPCTFRETDVKRAVRAVRAAGIEIAGVEIEPGTGKITITTSGISGAEKINELDKWIVEDTCRATINLV